MLPVLDILMLTLTALLYLRVASNFRIRSNVNLHNSHSHTQLIEMCENVMFLMSGFVLFA